MFIIQLQGMLNLMDSCVWGFHGTHSDCTYMQQCTQWCQKKTYLVDVDTCMLKYRIYFILEFKDGMKAQSMVFKGS